MFVCLTYILSLFISKTFCRCLPTKKRIIIVSHKIAFNRALINRRSYRRAGSSEKKFQKQQHGLGIYTDTTASAR